VGFGGFGLLPQPLHPMPLSAEDPLGLLGRMEHVQPVLRHRLTRDAAVLLQWRDPALQARARIRHDVLQRRPGAQRLPPRRPVPVGRATAEEPHQAGRLDTDQDGAAMEEDLIQASDQDQGVAPSVEDLQDATGATPGRLDDPMHSRAAGTGRGAQDDGQEPADSG
jgi:hypothetical protein